MKTSFFSSFEPRLKVVRFCSKKLFESEIVLRKLFQNLFELHYKDVRNFLKTCSFLVSYLQPINSSKKDNFLQFNFLTYVVLFASGGNPVPKRPEKKIKLVPNSSMV
jgi:hypothetical protein